MAPDYARRPPTATSDHPARAAALQLRRDHPGWGAGLIRVYLAERGLRPPPGESTLRRWFRRAGLAPAPPGRRPGTRAPRATEPHETWQVDAAEQIPLADGARVCWLRIVDECSGAVLRTAVFPPRALGGGAGGRDPGRVAPGLRPLGAAAAPAGRQRHPLGLGRELPTDLALWLIGSGVEIIWNPPRRPQDNGVVEHSQGTGKRWAEPATCKEDSPQPPSGDDRAGVIRRHSHSIVPGGLLVMS